MSILLSFGHLSESDAGKVGDWMVKHNLIRTWLVMASIYNCTESILFHNNLCWKLFYMSIKAVVAPKIKMVQVRPVGKRLFILASCPLFTLRPNKQTSLSAASSFRGL